MLRDVLLDIVKHTHSLGFIQAVKLENTDDGTMVEAMDEERTVVLKGKLNNKLEEVPGLIGMGRLSVLKGYLDYEGYGKDGANIEVVTSTRDGKDVAEELKFTTPSGYSSSYRFMVSSLIEEQLKTIKFKGVEWDITVQPTAQNLKDLAYFNSIMGGFEPTFVAKTDGDTLKFYIGDVRNYQSLNQALKDVDFVFHAAALKQVPTCEFFPMEAFKTNVIGTKNVIKYSIKNKIKRLVVLSTDKAVYPINTMGVTKSLAEKLVISNPLNFYDSSTIICATRYGNVIASRGSMIPLFINQIKQGKNLTITNPNMTRFLMSLANAVKLVDYAFEHGEQGDILVQKAPATTIETLAQALINIFNSKSKIKVIGIRHGEKMHETLLTEEEMFKADDLGDYYRVKSDSRGLNYDKYFSEGDVDNNVFAIQGRAFGKEQPKYLTIKLQENKQKIFGLERVNLHKLSLIHI